MDIILLRLGSLKFARNKSGKLMMDVDGYLSPTSSFDVGDHCTFIIEVCVVTYNTLVISVHT